ncbi:hypothetical protein BBG03_03485 [Streptococcus dysgalactiae subsp. equisimilis]|uniref:hypothetical protein n=1 Tax=Streptococcus dysgalactiae TaxID=1334 RepID=UPI00080717BC|nr:hypothetical protein [Streptococcus dysgalactiae]OBZ00657.1 hypothetical protein BBG03_03485 [Streptococcus dysgalactiae subsp. equisimilis]
MKKIEILTLLLFTSLLMIACSNEKKETKTATSQSSIVRIADSHPGSDGKVQTDNQVQVADEFMVTYIEQSFDLVKLKEKEEKLKKYAGDSSLDVAIQEISSLQMEVIDYKKKGKIEKMGSVTLIERAIHDVTIYQNGALYFADVSYSESSPAFEGSFDRRRQFTFKIEGNKVIKFEEVIYK